MFAHTVVSVGALRGDVTLDRRVSASCPSSSSCPPPSAASVRSG